MAAVEARPVGIQVHAVDVGPRYRVVGIELAEPLLRLLGVAGVRVVGDAVLDDYQHVPVPVVDALQVPEQHEQEHPVDQDVHFDLERGALLPVQQTEDVVRLLDVHLEVGPLVKGEGVLQVHDVVQLVLGLYALQARELGGVHAETPDGLHLVLLVRPVLLSVLLVLVDPVLLHLQ